MKIKWLALLLAPAIMLAVAPMPQLASAAAAQVVSSVSLRQNPNVNSERIRYLGQGEKVTIIEKVNAWWYKVRDMNGRVGYISTSSQYINTGGSLNSSHSSNNTSSSSSTSSNIQKVIQAGEKYLGTPYQFGSSRSNTRTFDCSDFTHQAFLEGINLKLPSDSRGQADYVRSIGKTSTDWHQLKAGDLMFFMNYLGPKASDYAGINKSKQRISHVGIYLGDGKILQTYSVASGGVRIDTIAGKHWEDRFIFGGSAIK